MRTKFWYGRFLMLDRYILREMSVHFFSSLVFIMFVFLMFQALRLAEFLIVHSVAPSVLLKMAGYLMISFLPHTLPVAFLISVLMSLGRLSADYELTAFFCSGFSLLRISFSLIAAAAALGICLFFLGNSWVPWGEKHFKKLQIKLANTKAVSTIKEGTFNSGFFDLLVFAEKVSSESNTLSNVFIYDDREASQSMVYVAKKASIKPLIPSQDGASAVFFQLENGSIYHHHTEQKSVEKIDFKLYQLYLKVNAGLGLTKLRPQMIPLIALKNQINQLPRDQKEFLELSGEFHRRIAVCFSPFFLLLFGAGWSRFPSRHVRSNAILVGLSVVVIYWILQAVGISGIIRKHWSPFVGMQLSNGFLLLVGLIVQNRKKM